MKKKKENVELQFQQAQVLMFFRQSPIAKAIKVLAEATGIVESRRIEERVPENK